MIFVRAKSTFLNSSGLKGVFEKLCFRDGLVWTVGVTVEIKLHIEFLPCSEVGTLKKNRRARHVESEYGTQRKIRKVSF